MYPFMRMFREGLKASRAPRLELFETHVSQHRCWPWDLDIWNELNNGRTLTLYDLGRVPLAVRAGLIATLRREGWGLTVAGSVVRYRRRVRGFDRVEMHSRLLGWDRRFLYIDQSMWKTDGQCASHAVFRSAVTGTQGIVAPGEVIQALGADVTESPALPAWVAAWIAAEDSRPWPPDRRA
jgi:acyl-CoA thioesterase FadM